jgi:hypothetical protein
LKTEYDNVAPSAVPQIRAWMLREGTAFQHRVSNFLAKFDRDVHRRSASEPGRARVALGSFSFVELEAQADNPKKRQPRKKSS